jgi:hypothetical protein
MLQCIVDQIRTLRKRGGSNAEASALHGIKSAGCHRIWNGKSLRVAIALGNMPVITHDFDESLLILELREHVRILP